MGQGMLHRLIAVFMDISKGFNCTCDFKAIEDLAILIHGIMSRRTRQFHTLEHVFGLIEGSDHITALAAVFHDLVYFQVDNGFPPELAALMDGYVRIDQDGLQLSENFSKNELALLALCSIFNVQPGSRLPVNGGLNEFLSAFVMIRLLSAYLGFEQLVAVLVCIEASIPFRGKDKNGQEVGVVLEQRLIDLRDTGLLTLDDADIQAMVHRAIGFANADVRDFSLPDPGHFLSNTWKLLPESNAALRQSNLYTIRDYRKALVGMRGFLASLTPQIIYHTYRGEPAAETIAGLYESANRNLRCAIDYFEAKILATGLLDAMASLSGGDVPIALFMGELPAEGRDGDHFMDFLPGVPEPEWLDSGDPVYRLLKDGRLGESSFDLRNSPLAMHLYLRLEPQNWKDCCKAAIEYVGGAIDAAQFMERLPKSLVADFLDASAHMVPTRRVVLESMIKDLHISA